MSQKTQADPRSPDKDGSPVFECDGLGDSVMFFPPQSLVYIQLVVLDPNQKGKLYFPAPAVNVRYGCNI